MVEFPKLKTGAVAQYGLQRELRGAIRVLSFLDGTEQRYRLEKARRRWKVKLEKLDEGEASAVDDFVRAHLTTLESFSFTDPWSGVTFNNCVVEASGHEVEALAAGNCRVELTIAEQEA